MQSVISKEIIGIVVLVVIGIAVAAETGIIEIAVAAETEITGIEAAVMTVKRFLGATTCASDVAFKDITLNNVRHRGKLSEISAAS